MSSEQFKVKGKIEEIWGDWDTLGCCNSSVLFL